MKKLASLLVVGLFAIALVGCNCEKSCGGCCGEDGACCKEACATSRGSSSCSE